MFVIILFSVTSLVANSLVAPDVEGDQEGKAAADQSAPPRGMADRSPLL